MFLFNASDAQDFYGLKMGVDHDPYPIRRDGGRTFDYPFNASYGPASTPTPTPTTVGSLPLHHSHPPP